MRLKDRIVRFREANHLTQAELAELLGVSKNYVYLVESERNTPGAKFVKNFEIIENSHQKSETKKNGFLGKSETSPNSEYDDLMILLNDFVKRENWGAVKELANQLIKKQIDDAKASIDN